VGEYAFRLPDIGEGTAEAEIVAWHVEVGDRVDEDGPLVDVMTEKATVELTAPVAGVVVKLGGAVGTMAGVGMIIAAFETDEDASISSAAPSPLAANSERVSDQGVPHEASANASSSRRPLASPAVRRRALERGVELTDLRGSGPGGRITQADLDAHEAVGPASAEAIKHAADVVRSGVEEAPLIGLRRQIAERMQLAKRSIPHFSYVEEIDVTELESLRAHLNDEAGAAAKLSFLPFLMRALVKVLPRYPDINATFDDAAEVLRRHAAVHIGIATQTSKGLLVPVVRNAEAKDLWECAAEIARLATAARDGKASRDELTGSTITITSLGKLGGVTVVPVINRPEVAIIGPNKIVERPVVRGGQIVIRKMMNLSCAFDHRIVDGYDAARFVQDIRERLEHPATLFMA
jgi:2-oxoisovalerate dehydrogenase E2 component (dihydrolipoyl transacylase)